jgi:hypothetical protein
VLVPGKVFQPSLMFVGKAGAYPRVEHIIFCKGLPGPNTLAYFEGRQREMKNRHKGLNVFRRRKINNKKNLF